MHRLSLISALASLAAVFYLVVRLGNMEKRLAQVTQSAVVPEESRGEGAAEQGAEVAVYMERIQSHAHKLWAAGTANDLPLAKFYLHEIDEVMEELEHAQIDEDGVPVSAHMKTYGLSTIDAFSADLKGNGLVDFDAQFSTLVNACNSCHDKCGYPFIRIMVPTTAPLGIQDFSPVD